jgi:hypothetical protein
MKRLYDEPFIEVRNYSLPPKDVVMTSTISGEDNSNAANLGDGADYNYFG